MATTISTADARKNFADIVNKVAYGKEPIVLTRRGQEIPALVPIEELECFSDLKTAWTLKMLKRLLRHLVTTSLLKKFGRNWDFNKCSFLYNFGQRC